MKQLGLQRQNAEYDIDLVRNAIVSLWKVQIVAWVLLDSVYSPDEWNEGTKIGCANAACKIDP